MKDEEEDDELMLMETTGQKQTDATTQEEMETFNDLFCHIPVVQKCDQIN